MACINLVAYQPADNGQVHTSTLCIYRYASVNSFLVSHAIAPLRNSD